MHSPLSTHQLYIVIKDYHSGLIMNLIKLKGTAKLTAQGEQVCLKDSKYILFELLENQTWKGGTSSCRPSQQNCQIGFAWPAGACTALLCLIFQDFKQNIFGILETYLYIQFSQFCCTFQLYQIPVQRSVRHKIRRTDLVRSNFLQNILCSNYTSNLSM